MLIEEAVPNPFAEYYNKHLGEKAILFGSGPTILEFNSGQVPPDVLRFGINDQIFLNLDLDYWFMGDNHRQDPDYFFGKFDLYNDYEPNKQKFVRFCNWDKDQFIEIYGNKVNRNGQLPLDMKYSKYYTADSCGNPDECAFNNDLSVGNLYAVASITFEILQFTLYTGIDKSFLIGHDCNYTDGDYNKSVIGKNLNAGYWISKYWDVCKPWIEKKYPNLKIYWVDPVGVQLFNCITLEESYELMETL